MRVESEVHFMKGPANQLLLEALESLQQAGRGQAEAHM
jgi:hypothetical protein